MAFGGYVQDSGHSGYNPGTSVNRSLIGVTAGNILVMSVSFQAPGDGTWTFSDGVNTWNTGPKVAANGFQVIGYALNVASGNVTVTASTTGSSAQIDAILVEYSGTTTAVFDSQNTNNGSGAGTTTSIALTTAQNNELVVVGGNDGNPTTFDAPMSTRGNPTNPGFTNTADNVYATAGAQNITGTRTSGSGWGLVVLSFAAASPSPAKGNSSNILWQGQHVNSMQNSGEY
jgi:hypothetical protein